MVGLSKILEFGDKTADVKLYPPPCQHMAREEGLASVLSVTEMLEEVRRMVFTLEFSEGGSALGRVELAANEDCWLHQGDMITISPSRA